MNKALKLLDTQSLVQPKILLVEDSEFDMALLKRIIQNHFPYTLIDCVTRKAHALYCLGYNFYDLIFLDLNLPDSLGLHDVNDIREQALDTPVIVVTGEYDADTARRVKPFGVTGFICKRDIVSKNFPLMLREAIENINNAQPL